MEQSPITNPILELIDRPAFCVRDGIIIQTNQAANQIQIQTGTHIGEYLTGDLQAYQNFESGCLAVTLHISGAACTASVTRTNEYDVFRIEQDPALPELKTLSLAAQHIRVPLATALTISDQLFAKLGGNSDMEIAQLNKALYQLHRLICNISDAARCSNTANTKMQTVNLTAVFDEIFEKASAVMESAGFHLQFTGLEHAVFGLADSEKLSRATYNILSNAAKFSPKGSTIDAKLTRNGDMLHFTVQDEGPGISREILSNVFSRFLRQPGIEDGRNGIGLGIPLIHAIAAAHGGTLLIDHPEGHGARITMTLQIRTGDADMFRAPVLPIGDYAGGRDMALLELSEVLPPESYRNIN